MHIHPVDDLSFRSLRERDVEKRDFEFKPFKVLVRCLPHLVMVVVFDAVPQVVVDVAVLDGDVASSRVDVNTVAPVARHVGVTDNHDRVGLGYVQT